MHWSRSKITNNEASEPEQLPSVISAYIICYTGDILHRQSYCLHFVGTCKSLGGRNWDDDGDCHYAYTHSFGIQVVQSNCGGMERIG